MVNAHYSSIRVVCNNTLAIILKGQQRTEFTDHERRAMSTDHRLDFAWFGAGAAIKQRGLEQTLRMVA